MTINRELTRQFGAIWAERGRNAIASREIETMTKPMTHAEYAWKVAEIAQFATAHLERTLAVAVEAGMANKAIDENVADGFAMGMRYRLDALAKRP